MSKAAQRRRQREARRPLWVVHTRYSDGSGQVDAFATEQEAQRMVDAVNALRLREPEGIVSVELVREGGHG